MQNSTPCSGVTGVIYVIFKFGGGGEFCTPNYKRSYINMGLEKSLF
jgi:hypothetical protein